MLLLVTALLSPAALAAPAGYKVAEADHNGCEISLGPAASDGVVPIHAVCRWPDVTLAKWDQVVGDWTKHDDIFGVVVSSDVRRSEAARDLVYQLHRTKGISDREVLLWMTKTTVNGAHRYGWTTAKDQPLTLTDGNVQVARSEGYWQAAPDPAGGVVVEHHLEYGPGGSVPGFMVRWFQTSGLETNLDEMRAAVR